MNQKTLDSKTLQETVDAVYQHGSISAAADLKGIARSTMKHRYHRALNNGFTPRKDVEPDIEHRLRLAEDRNKALETQLQRKHSERAIEAWIRNELFKMVQTPPTPPSWVNNPGKMAHSSPGTPFLALGDWHWGEVIDPNQIDGLNEYNINIAHRRAKNVIDTAVDLLQHHMVKPDYPGIVVSLLGDMVSGDIHQELQETNELPTIPTVLDVVGVMQQSLKYLADQFGRVHVVCVVGNHGRNTKKMQAKGRTATSFDWLSYKILELQCNDDDRITFQIPDGADTRLRVYSHDYLITHGDQFRGGDGIIGPLGPLCVTPETPVLMEDLAYKPAGEIQAGDKVVGFDEHGVDGSRRRFRESEVTQVQDLELECIEIETSDGCVTTASLGHPWLTRSGTSHAWMRTDRLRIGSRILSLGAPVSRHDSWDAGYLAGVLDGEGHVEKKGRMKFSQHDNACYETARDILDAFGIPYATRANDAEARGYEACFNTVLNPGRENSGVEHLRLFALLRPPRLLAEQGRRLWEGRSVQIADEVTVVGVRYVGSKSVKGFTTSTATFVANGMLTHNTRGDYKKRLRESMVDNHYDTMVCGHFHRLITLSQFIINGSLVGYNEYAYTANFPYEPPRQALWVTHPRNGITFTLPVLAEKLEKKADAAKWLSLPA